MIEELYKACCDFKATYRVAPAEMLMHPSVYEDISMIAADTMMHLVTAPSVAITLYGVPIKEDVKLPVGLVRFKKGDKTGQLWLTKYQ